MLKLFFHLRRTEISICLSYQMKRGRELPEELRRIVLEGDPTREISFSYDNKKNGRRGEIHRRVGGTFHVGPVTYHILKAVSVDIHKRALTCITGVSGSGKSSLLYGGILPEMEKSKEFDEVVLVESKISASSSRSILATYAGIMDDIHALFSSTTRAQELEYTEADFGFNRGTLRCEHCKGEGRINIPYTEAAYKSCPICHGSRYRREVPL